MTDSASSSVTSSLLLQLWSVYAPLSLTLRVVLPILASWGAWTLYSFFLHPLSRYPGPLSARLGLPWWRFYNAYKGTYAFELQALHVRHGPVVRIGPTHVSFSDPRALTSFYALSNGVSSKFIKSHFYRSFEAIKGRPSIFSERDVEKHAKRKRAISPAYSMASLVKLEEYVEDVSELLLRRLNENLDAASPSPASEPTTATLRLDHWFHYLAMDVVGEIAFGKSFQLLQDGPKEENETFLTGVLNLSQWGGVAGCIPVLSLLIIFVLRRLSGEPGGEVVGTKTQGRIDERYAQMMEGTEPMRPDMLTRFMEAKHPDTGATYSRGDVIASALSVIGAGSDTTATALTIILGYLVAHPACYAKVRAEIDAAVDEGRLVSPVKYAKGTQLPYLQACIKEALRLHPPIGMDLPRYVPAGGAMIADKWYVPAGTTIGISPYVLHRNKAAFGIDAEIYRPERWLEGGEEGRKQLERYNFTFGGGSRQCIGKNISLMEVSKIVPELLMRFDFAAASATDGQAVKGSLPFERKSVWFTEASNLVVDVTRRDSAV